MNVKREINCISISYIKFLSLEPQSRIQLIFVATKLQPSTVAHLNLKDIHKGFVLTVHFILTVLISYIIKYLSLPDMFWKQPGIVRQLSHTIPLYGQKVASK